MRSNLHKDDANEVVVEQAARLAELTGKLAEIRTIVSEGQYAGEPTSGGELADRVKEVLDR